MADRQVNGRNAGLMRLNLQADSDPLPGMIVSSRLELVSVVDVGHPEPVLAPDLARYRPGDTVLAAAFFQIAGVAVVIPVVVLRLVNIVDTCIDIYTAVVILPVYIAADKDAFAVVAARVALALRTYIFTMLLRFVNRIVFVEWFYVCHTGKAAERVFLISKCSSGSEYSKQGGCYQCQWFTAGCFSENGCTANRCTVHGVGPSW